MMNKLFLLATVLLTVFGNGVITGLNIYPSPTNLITQIGLADRNISAIAHSRKRRYVVFPRGSHFAVAFSIKLEVAADAIFTEGVNWGLAYDLPNETFTDIDNPAPLPLRRQKRDLYKRVEILLNSAGFDGRLCLLRTICETAQLIPTREGVVQEIIRLIFTYPLTKASDTLRPGRHREYSNAHSHGITDQSCNDNFPCPFSIMGLLLQFGMKTNDE